MLYEEVAALLDRAAAELPAAEAHGCLCGALCVNGQYSLPEWLATLGLELAGSDSPLQSLFESTVEVLRGETMAFTPLLPDDDTVLTARTEALAQWVQGFLYGLAAGEIGRNKPDLPEDVREILQDFAEISRVAPVEESGDEADEQAFTELLEFVRVGVQLVHDELLPLRHT